MVFHQRLVRETFLKLLHHIFQIEVMQQRIDKRCRWIQMVELLRSHVKDYGFISYPFDVNTRSWVERRSYRVSL